MNSQSQSRINHLLWTHITRYWKAGFELKLRTITSALEHV
uniref:Uncharacterized protein n=1 Tax=Rhizophora mucronata TaxID=61149 RepID=A0A2P2NMV2_RHIMU